MCHSLCHCASRNRGHWGAPSPTYLLQTDRPPIVGMHPVCILLRLANFSHYRHFGWIGTVVWYWYFCRYELNIQKKFETCPEEISPQKSCTAPYIEKRVCRDRAKLSTCKKQKDSLNNDCKTRNNDNWWNTREQVLKSKYQFLIFYSNNESETRNNYNSLDA